MPATVAAVTSPWLWPTTTSGRTPASLHSSASPTDMAHSVGCSMSMRDNHSSPASPERMAVRSHGKCGSNARAQRRITAAKVGLAANRSRPIPAHCDPWPGNTNAVRPAGSARPLTTSGISASGSAAKRARSARSVSVSVATNPTRVGKWSRRRASVPTSASRRRPYPSDALCGCCASASRRSATR